MPPADVRACCSPQPASTGCHYLFYTRGRIYYPKLPQLIPNRHDCSERLMERQLLGYVKCWVAAAGALIHLLRWPWVQRCRAGC